MLKIMFGCIIRMSNALTKNTVSTFYGDCITGISENEKFQKYFNIACIFESGFFVAYIDLVD